MRFGYNNPMKRNKNKKIDIIKILKFEIKMIALCNCKSIIVIEGNRIS